VVYDDIMSPIDRLGPALRRLRQRRGWTQKELARASGLSADVVSRYERGVRRPGLGTLWNLLEAMESDLGELHQALESAGGRAAGGRAAGGRAAGGRAASIRLSELETELFDFRAIIEMLGESAALLAAKAPDGIGEIPPPEPGSVTLGFHPEGQLGRWILEPDLPPSGFAEPSAGSGRRRRKKAYGEQLRKIEENLERIRRRRSLPLPGPRADGDPAIRRSDDRE